MTNHAGTESAQPSAKTALSGQVAVVTGASSGIGEAIARELAMAGVRLLLVARRADRLAALQKTLPVESVVVAAAIDDPATPQRLLQAALSAFGRVDIVINNAGVVVTGTLDTIDLDALAAMTRVNFDAVVRASYVFARHFKPHGRGAIINVSSIGAYLSHSSMGVYSGLKQALETFTTALRVELRGSGVRVGTIAPGTTDTEIFAPARQRGEAVRADQTQPLAPADVAAAVRFMLEQPAHANVARLLLVPASEMA